MTINLKAPELRELKPRIMVCGVGGAGGNAVNNMIVSGLAGVDFIVANTDAQALASSKAERIIQMGLQVTEGLGAGSKPEVGRAAAEEAIEEIRDHLAGAHMVFVTAGMGGGTGTGAAPVVARVAREMGILTVGVVTKPFQFEGGRRMRLAEGGIAELQKSVDTLIIIPNQNLFRVANEKTTFADAFAMADQVLYSGVACITDLMVKEGLINLDFADVRSIMSEMGKAMMGTGEASGDRRAVLAAEAAIANPLLDEVSMKGARGLLISITGGNDLTLYEVDEAASRIRQEVDEEANIILGATFDQSLDGVVRVSVVATGIDQTTLEIHEPSASQLRIIEAQQRLRAQATRAQPTPLPRRDAEAPSVAASSPSDGRCRRLPTKSKSVPPRQKRPSMPRRPRRALRSPTTQDYIPPAPEQPRHPAGAHAANRGFAAGRSAADPRPSRRTIRPGRSGRDATAFAAGEARGLRHQPTRRSAASSPPRARSRRACRRPRRSRVPVNRPCFTPITGARSRASPPPRAAQGSLDPHGRMAARPAALEEDQLEIPAFLRRQSS